MVCGATSVTTPAGTGSLAAVCAGPKLSVSTRCLARLDQLGQAVAAIQIFVRRNWSDWAVREALVSEIQGRVFT